MLRERPSSPPAPSPRACSSAHAGATGFAGLGSRARRRLSPSTSTSVSSSLLVLWACPPAQAAGGSEAVRPLQRRDPGRPGRGEAPSPGRRGAGGTDDRPPRQRRGPVLSVCKLQGRLPPKSTLLRPTASSITASRPSQLWPALLGPSLLSPAPQVGPPPQLCSPHCAVTRCLAHAAHGPHSRRGPDPSHLTWPPRAPGLDARLPAAHLHLGVPRGPGTQHAALPTGSLLLSPGVGGHTASQPGPRARTQTPRASCLPQSGSSGAWPDHCGCLAS